MTDEKIRAFLAVGLPAETRRGIADIQKKLKSVMGGVKWVRPEGMHLTLKFFGDISMADVGRISEVVDKNTRNITHFVLSLKKLGVFPGLGRPRVLWLGTEGDVQRLCDLQKTIDDGLDLCGFQKDERPFKPHLTLGRFKSPLKNISALQEVLERADAFEAGSFDVGSLSLFKSDLRPDGAVYTEISRFPLKGS